MDMPILLVFKENTLRRSGAFSKYWLVCSASTSRDVFRDRGRTKDTLMNYHLNVANSTLDPAAMSGETRAQTRYDACHDDDDFESLKQRAVFSRESAGLYRQWLQAAARELANEQARGPDAG
jgi:hypothetical protein